MGLREYQRKRHFDRTPEPGAKVVQRGRGRTVRRLLIGRRLPGWPTTALLGALPNMVVVQ